MFAIKNVPLVGKVLLIIAVFGVLSVVSIVYSTSVMRHINDGYVSALDHEAAGSLALSRSNRAMGAMVGAIAQLEISTSDEGNKAAINELKAAREVATQNIALARSALPDYSAAVDELGARITTAIDKTCDKAIKMGLDNTSPAAVLAAQTEYLKNCEPVVAPIAKDLSALSNKAVADMSATRENLTATTAGSITTTYVVVLGGLTFVVALGYFAVTAWISRPIKGLVQIMTHLAGGDLSVVVVGTERKDEIGPMAKAVQIFKDNGLKLKASEAEAARQRMAAEQERAANEAARAEIQRQQEAVVATIAEGLDRLSQGDLTGRLNQAFASEYEKLRTDFNATAKSLQEALSTIATATDGISNGSDQIATASDDLSRRTEQQAASLEETSAALNIITQTVKAMAADTAEASKVVATTRNAAETSGAVVTQAVEAMGKIKDSSTQITNIIGVIDEIAFQTNLLALNAGVEAARAGDAGRGFAVVASEVRGLAQRSAEAAKEIKALISASSTQVEAGVVLVDKTGVALKDIVAKVAEMDALVRKISAASQEQATGLAEINTAVSQMDQVVQQNAAMVEESTAAAHALKGEAQDLTTMVGRFEIGGDKRREPARNNPVHKAQASIAKNMNAAPRKVASVPMMKTTSSAAAQNDWKEF
jgi:methyl-accepting chemotaxis protein